MDDYTVVELLERAAQRIKNTSNDGGRVAREFAIAVTHIEDAQMRFTRGLAMVQGKFAPADMEK